MALVQLFVSVGSVSSAITSTLTLTLTLTFLQCAPGLSLSSTLVCLGGGLYSLGAFYSKVSQVDSFSSFLLRSF